LLKLILDRYLYKENVQDLADELGVAVSGTKGEIISRVIDDEGFDPADALSYLDKWQFRDLCDELDISDRGTRDELFGRVLKRIGG
jgi:hypothetical protein